jgi:hypothetical protein
MKKILLLITLSNLFFVNAQQTDNLFTIVSKANADFSTTIRLGAFNPTSCFVENIGTTTSQNNFSINGGSLNQIINRFNLVSIDSMLSFDLTDGSIVSELPINSFYSGTTFFTNVRFNTSDNTLYGLASTFQDNNTLIGMYLAKLNTETGNLTAVSQSSIGTGYQLAGTAINPQLMVYYFSTGSKFMGIDLYNGTVYSNPDIVFSSPNDFNFSNFTYNCSDNTIYGLVTEAIQVPNPNSSVPTNSYQMRFGKINPTTGEVSYISETPLPSWSYSLNAGSTIDPITNTYYFCDGANVYGISLLTGLLVSTTPLTYEDGMYINMMTNYNNCLGAVPTRLDPSLSTNENNVKANVVVYPNPTSNNLTIDSETPIDGVEVIDSNGRVVNVVRLNSFTLNVQNLQSGIYFLKVTSNHLVQVLKFVKT